MKPFQRILFPSDFSDRARSAQDYACALADEFGAELHVLTVVQDVALVLPETGMFLTLPMPMISELVSAAETALRTAFPADWIQRHPVVLKAEAGVPFQQILDYAEQHRIDLIVMGTHGRTGLQHVLLGSVAERVVRGAKCPVLTIRTETKKH